MKYLWMLTFLMLSENIFAQTPSVKVLDTDFSKGRLTYQQTITLDDAAKFMAIYAMGL